MKKAYIFDFDGLIADTEPTYYTFFNALLPAGKKLSLQDYLRNYSGKGIRENFERLIKEFDLDLSIQDCLAQLESRNDIFLAADLKEGAADLLHFLKAENPDVIIGLVTSNTKERVSQLLSRHGVLDFFDLFTFGNEVEQGKPHPDIYLKMLEKLNLPAKECLVFEDSDAGILSASAAGLDVIAIPDMKENEAKIVKKAKGVYPSLRAYLKAMHPDRIS